MGSFAFSKAFDAGKFDKTKTAIFTHKQIIVKSRDKRHTIA